MIAEIRQLLLKPSQENFNKLLELIRELDADSVEVQYVKNHTKSWPSGFRKIEISRNVFELRIPPRSTEEIEVTSDKNMQILQVDIQQPDRAFGVVWGQAASLISIAHRSFVIENRALVENRVFVSVLLAGLPGPSWAEIFSATPNEFA